jgi:hypothetical protein
MTTSTRNFTEPMFVFAIMVIAGTRPGPAVSGSLVRWWRGSCRCPRHGRLLLVLSFVPLLGSFITEPAAMTLAALMLRDTLFSQPTSTRLKYATLGVLFVNISIGGTLTPFAAPPVLMVAAKWDWDIVVHAQPTSAGRRPWRSVVNAGWCDAAVPPRVGHMANRTSGGCQDPVCPGRAGVHLLFLMGVVVFAHHPAMFMGLFLFFLGFRHRL